MDNHDIAIERCNRRAAQAAIDLAAALEAGTTVLGTSEDGNPSLTYVFPSTLQMQAARDAWQHYALIQVDEPADVALTAAQRAAAQIGYELFGRHDLDLIEIANRVRELRGDGPALLVGGRTAPAGRIDAETLWWLQDAINTMAEGGNQSHVRFLQRLHDTLSAQPSPGGQGDAHGPVLQEMCARLNDAGSPARTAALDAAIAALAARQPAGQEPVTVVAAVRRDGEGDCYIDWLTEGGIADLEVGDVLMVSDRAITDEDGSGEVYAAPAQAVDPGPRPMDAAPRDGTMVCLLVQFDENSTEDTTKPAWTIGACNDDNLGEDERIGFQFARWCWTHDHFTEGKATPIGWLPLIDSEAAGNG
ncbi:hypothetical protein Q2B95_08080 [Stenotrophomonas maltophilia]|uniref:hypothetical protein n=1 Tax=Stenotrophomonas maltophilia TaxID=40324 RepID=UPI0030A3F0C7